MAQAIQAQLLANLGIDATLDPQDDTTYLDTADAGLLDGMHLLGWGADYPDMTNFLDYHFGAGASISSATSSTTSPPLCRPAPPVPTMRREPSCVEANNAIRTRTCRWSRSPTASPAWPTRPT